MTRTSRRLKKLERFLTDSSGLVPCSPRWFTYWRGEIEKLLKHEPHELLPLEAVRLWLCGRWPGFSESSEPAEPAGGRPIAQMIAGDSR